MTDTSNLTLNQATDLKKTADEIARQQGKHQDKAPERTITERELERAVDETNNEDMNEYQKAHALLVYLGYTIPERPNAERLAMLVGAFTRMGSYTIDEFGEWLDEHGVKAGDNEAKIKAAALRDAANRIPVAYRSGDSPSAWLDRAADRIEADQ